MAGRRTSARVAKLAAKVLKDKGATKAEKSAAGSALAQRSKGGHRRKK